MDQFDQVWILCAAGGIACAVISLGHLRPEGGVAG
jgi:hypothetical protein